MLLNEFLKEHREVEEQERRILEQEATVARLKTDLEANAAVALCPLGSENYRVVGRRRRFG